MKRSKYAITGPAVTETRETYAVALSFATTLANHAAISSLDNTYYVSDPDGHVVGHAESHADDRSVSIFGVEHYEAVAA